MFLAILAPTTIFTKAALTPARYGPGLNRQIKYEQGQSNCPLEHTGVCFCTINTVYCRPMICLHYWVLKPLVGIGCLQDFKISSVFSFSGYPFIR